MERIGQYRVLQRLGEGGMGVVHLAEEELSGRRVVLKLMRQHIAGSERDRKRFINEAGLLSRLSHPNIVRCLACLEHEGQLAIAMELLQGETLREHLTRRGRVPFAEVAAWTRQLCAGLAHAHGADPPVAHRDFKPENLMLLPEGQLKIMDFGIAKAAGATTQTVSAVGTLRYMSPEQIDAREIDTRCDIYSLGVVLHELLSGAPPFTVESPRQLLNAICTERPPPLPDDVRRELPAGFEALLRAMLEKRADDRPQSAEAVVAALDALQQGQTAGLSSDAREPAEPSQPVNAQPAPSDARRPKPVRLVAIALGAVGAVALGVLALSDKGGSRAHPRPAAQSAPQTRSLDPTPSGADEPSLPKVAAAVADAPETQEAAPTDTPSAAVDAGDQANPETSSPNTPPTLEDHYLGPHSLGVNRVTNGQRSGTASITRKDGKLFLSGSVRRGAYRLSLSGFVTPKSKREFVLDGVISGVPDLSWRDVPPTPVRTRARFTFRIKGSRPYWRMYEVNGKDCVCDDNCGNDFCYIDVGL